MIGRGFSPRHTMLVARFSARHALRTGAGIIYLMIALGFCLYGSYSGKGCGAFCCLLMLMSITPCVGGFWFIYWMWQVYEKAK